MSALAEVAVPARLRECPCFGTAFQEGTPRLRAPSSYARLQLQVAPVPVIEIVTDTHPQSHPRCVSQSWTIGIPLAVPSLGIFCVDLLIPLSGVENEAQELRGLGSVSRKPCSPLWA